MTVSFGMDLSTSAAPGADPVADARLAEEVGFDFVSATDHLHGTHPTYETWTLLAWVAASTSRIGIATRVLGLPYRQPPVLAKMAESLDRLSGGRLILGLGAGASDEEFRSFGLGARTPREKVDALAEAIEVIRGVWSQPGFTVTGAHYRTEGAQVEPKPPRRIPIWLGTFGPRALAVTGRLADGWIPSLGYAPPDQVVRMRERVLTAARQAGRDPAAITCAYNVPVRVDDRGDAPPSVVAGHPDTVAERLRGFVALGFTTLNLIPTGPDRAGQVRRLASEVLPAVRA